MKIYKLADGHHQFLLGGCLHVGATGDQMAICQYADIFDMGNLQRRDRGESV